MTDRKPADPSSDPRFTHTMLTRRTLLTSTLLGSAFMDAGESSAQSSGGLPSSARELWQWVRTQPVLESQIIYLDTASVGPTWRAAMAAEYRAREQQSMDVASNTRRDRWVKESELLAKRFAAFCGCDFDEIVFTRGAGEAISTVAAGLDLNAGDEVLTGSQEHPAALSPWLFLARRRGVVIKQVSLPSPMSGAEEALGRFAGAVTPRTRVMAFNHVQYADGTVLPVRELCQFARRRNIVTVVNGSQAVGMLEIRLRELDCDFYASGLHKWLGGCHGTGLLFVRREMRDRLWPAQARGIDAFPPVYTPTQSMAHTDVPAALHKFGNVVPHLWPALRGSLAALELHEQIGRTRIEARVRELAILTRLRLQQLTRVEVLTPARAGSWAGILTFRVPGRKAEEIATALGLNNRVYVRVLSMPQDEDGALRAALHIFNSSEDAERLAQGLQRILGK